MQSEDSTPIAALTADDVPIVVGSVCMPAVAQRTSIAPHHETMIFAPHETISQQLHPSATNAESVSVQDCQLVGAAGQHAAHFQANHVQNFEENRVQELGLNSVKSTEEATYVTTNTNFKSEFADPASYMPSFLLEDNKDMLDAAATVLGTEADTSDDEARSFLVRIAINNLHN